MVAAVVKGYLSLANGLSQVPRERASAVVRGVVDASGRTAAAAAPLVQHATHIGGELVSVGLRQGVQLTSEVRTKAEGVITAVDRHVTSLEDLLVSLIAPRSNRAAARSQPPGGTAAATTRRLSRPAPGAEDATAAATSGEAGDSADVEPGQPPTGSDTESPPDES